MNSSNNLSIIHPDTIECVSSPVSNMPFDEALDIRNSDCISSEVLEGNNTSDSVDTLEEASRIEREIDDAYDKAFQSKITKEYPKLYINLPPMPPTKEEVEEVEEIDEKTYKGVFYADAMDMEAAMKEDVKWKKFREGKLKPLTGNDKFYARKFYAVKDKIGDGEMKYIKDTNTREMLTNAWKAITFSNNWDFVAKDIDSFMISNDPRIDEITEKMEEFGYNGHSGCSFGFTIRYMQLLVQKGEEEFKNCFK